MLTTQWFTGKELIENQMQYHEDFLKQLHREVLPQEFQY